MRVPLERIFRPWRGPKASGTSPSGVGMRAPHTSQDRLIEAYSVADGQGREACRMQRVVRPRLYKSRRAPYRPLALMLPADNRRCRTWTRNRICVAMNELPTSALQPKHAGHADSHRQHFLSTSDLTSTAFHLDDAGEVVGDVLRYEFDIGDFSVAVMRGGAGKCRFNLLPTAYVWPEGIPQGHVIRQRVQRLVNTRVAFQYRPEGCVALFDRAGEVVCGHIAVSFRLGCSDLPGGKCGIERGASESPGPLEDCRSPLPQEAAAPGRSTSHPF